jgi:hypothetical protein
VTDQPTPGRRRAYVFPGRHKRRFARFTDTEYVEVIIAADRFGLTPTGFCAHAALDAARNQHTGTPAHRHTGTRTEHEALTNLQAELFQARVALNQLRAELHLTRDDERTSSDDLDKAVTRTVHAIADVDNLRARIHQRLATRRPV